jgi:hypothetical protein
MKLLEETQEEKEESSMKNKELKILIQEIII